MNRRQFLRLGATGGLGLGAYSLGAPHLFIVSRHRVVLAGLRRPVRVVQLADLHFGSVWREGSVRAWVSAALETRADLVLVTGDFVDVAAPPERLAVLGNELARLRAPLGVWGVLGNHDYSWWNGSPDEGVGALVGVLESAGVQLLVNAGTALRPDLFLAGLDDLWNGQPDLGLTLAGLPGAGAVLLMSHNPDILPEVPERVGLTLCGHTHGGQVALPLVGPLHVPSRYGNRFASGFVRGPAPGFVSRGLGTTGPPVRVGCPPELVVLELVPA